MGQIRGKNAHIDACNLRSLSSFGTPAAGQHILVSTDNSAMQNGQGNFDAYVVGDGHTAATALPLIKIYANDADDEPTAGSENLVKSGGVLGAIGEFALCIKEEMTPLVVTDNAALTYGGLTVSDNNSEIKRYEVIAGQVLVLDLSKDNNVVCQWQNSNYIPSSGTNANLVGSPYVTAVNGIVKVPSGAVRLMVSQLKTNTTNKVYRAYDAVDVYPEPNSKNLLSSGGAWEAKLEADAAFDKIGGTRVVPIPTTLGSGISNNVFYPLKIKAGTVQIGAFNVGGAIASGVTELGFYPYVNGVRQSSISIPIDKTSDKTFTSDVDGFSIYSASSGIAATGHFDVKVITATAIDEKIESNTALADRKVEKLDYIGPNSSGHTWSIGDKMFNTTLNVINVCTSTSPFVLVRHTPSKESIYLYEYSLYYWDGTTLIDFNGDLQDEVTRNGRRINSLSDDVHTFSPSIFQIGSVYNGSITPSTISIATTNVQKASRSILISAKSGYRFVIHFYDGESTYTSNSGWRTSYRIVDGDYYRIQVSSTTGTVNADVNTFSQGVEFIEEQGLEIPLDVLGKASKKFNATSGSDITQIYLHDGGVFPILIKEGQKFSVAISGAITNGVNFYAIKEDDTHVSLGGQGTYFAPFDIAAIGIYVASSYISTGEYTISITGASINDMSLALIGRGKLEYYGKKIPSLNPFVNKFYCSEEILISVNMPDGGYQPAWAAGLVVYNGYAFSFNDGNTCSIFDLSTNTLIENASLPWSSHNNNAQPTPYFYDADDDYPLFIVSRGDYAGEGEQKFYFVRVVENEGSFTFTIVKTISYSDFTGAQYNVSWFANYEKNELFCYTYPNGAWNVKENNPIIIHKFAMPSLDNYDDVTLTGNDIVSTITMLDHWTMQSCLYHDNKIYMQASRGLNDDGITLNGVPYDKSKGVCFLFIIDPDSGYIETIIPLYNFIEQEGMCIYDGALYMSEKYSTATIGQICFRLLKYKFD